MGSLKRFFMWLARVIDGVRRVVLNLVFIAFIAVVVIVMTRPAPSDPHGASHLLRATRSIEDPVSFDHQLGLGRTDAAA